MPACYQGLRGFLNRFLCYLLGETTRTLTDDIAPHGKAGRQNSAAADDMDAHGRIPSDSYCDPRAAFEMAGRELASQWAMNARRNLGGRRSGRW